MPDQYPRISVVMPSFNQGQFIEESIRSVIDQQYPNLEFIVVDGGSSDQTVDILNKYEGSIHSWISEKDNGLYDALNKGFQKASGDIMGWLNSDDLLFRNSLHILADIFSNNPAVDWVQGHPCVADETGRIVFQRPPRASRFSFLEKQYHDGIFIQQESTYWRRSLWQKSGSSVSTKYKYAGDFELWMRFFQHSDLYTTSALIGAFRMRKGQLSQKHYDVYLKECDEIIDTHLGELTAQEAEQFEKITRSANPGLAARIMRKIGKTGDQPKAISRTVEYDHDLRVFKKSENQA